MSEEEGETYPSHSCPKYLPSPGGLHISPLLGFTNCSCLRYLIPSTTIICKAASLTVELGLLFAMQNCCIYFFDPWPSKLCSFRPAGNSEPAYWRVRYLLMASPFSTQRHKGPAKALKLNPQTPPGCACTYYMKRSLWKGERRDKECGFLLLVSIVSIFWFL